MLGVLIALKTTQFTDIENAQTYISNAMIDGNDHTIDLFQLKYRFAIEKPDARVGVIKAFQNGQITLSDEELGAYGDEWEQQEYRKKQDISPSYIS